MFARILSLTLAVSIAASASLLAQTEEPTPATQGGQLSEDFLNNTYFAIGLNLSRVTGTGVGGRLSLPKGVIVQLAAFVITIGDYTHFNIGGEAQYAFVRNSEGRFYALLGTGYYFSAHKDRDGNVINDPFALSLGVGYEWFLSSHIAWNLAGAISYFPATSKVYPLPEMGLYFYFR